MTIKLNPWLQLACLLAGLLFSPKTWSQNVVINEAMASNATTLYDEDGDAPDWLELYNKGTQEIDLSGFGLTDSSKDPFKWVFPKTTIDANGFLVVFLSGKNRAPEPASPAMPDSISGLVLWLKADGINPDDITQIRQDGGNSYVAQWVDQSGQNNPALCNDVNSQPQWSSNQFNGYPSLHFDGINDGLFLSRVPASNDFCLIVVARPEQTRAKDVQSNTSLSGIAGQHYLFGASFGGTTASGAGLSLGVNGAGVYEHGADYMPALVDYEGAIGTNLAVVTVNYHALTPTFFLQSYIHRQGLTSLRQTVMAPVQIGLGSYGSFAGDIAEVLMYNRSLSDGERLSLESYLANKYGIAIPLPRHTNFKLSASGETLRLINPKGSTEDKLASVYMPRDVSYGRQPDGAKTLYYFTVPTPGASNSTTSMTELVASPLFSSQGGFYTFEFPLTLTVQNPSAVIHYTLDGSEPTEASPIYREPLMITSRIGATNDISTIPTTPLGSGWVPPSGEVFKGWVVRARAFKQGALSRPSTTQSYWVDPLGRNRYTLPVISLVTDRANLFDPLIGIYVPGLSATGNYMQTGPDWERPVHVEFYETNNSLAFSQDAGVSIHGNTSQYQSNKGLDIDSTFVEGHSDFQYPIFPDRTRTTFSHFLLRPSGQDQSLAFMRDELTQSLATETDADTQASRACIVFINGEYWGLNYLKEKDDTAYITNLSGLPANELEFLENYAAAVLGDTGMYWDMVNFLTTADLTASDAYARAQSYLQITNYTDFKALETFVYRWDIGGAQRMWRPRNAEGRFRWLDFDYDVAFGGFGATQPSSWSFNMLHAEVTPDGSLNWHNDETRVMQLRQLLKIPQFQQEFIVRYADMLNSVLTPEHVIAHIDALARTLEPEMAEHTLRWSEPASLLDWKTNVQYLRDYASERPAYARQEIISQFGLSGSCSFKVSVSDTNQGAIQANTITIDAPSQSPWTGVYFKDIPIHLTAVPKPGYVFSHWEGLPESNSADQSNKNTTLTPTGDLTLLAVFRKSLLPSICASQWFGNGIFELSFKGEPNQNLELQSSTNLLFWTPVETVTLNSSGAAGITLLKLASTPYCYFRLLQN